MRSLCFATLLCLLPSTSKADEIDDKFFRQLDVFGLEYASDPQISPDANQVVYVRNSMDIMKDRKRSNLWIVGVDGRNHQPLTTDGTASNPVWSWEGKRVFYVSSSDEGAEIYCRWMETGVTSRLTQLPESPSNLSLSQDSKWIAFSMLVHEKPKPFVAMPPKPEGAEWAAPPKVIRKLDYRFDGKGYLKDGYHQLFVIPAEGGTPRQLTRGNFHHRGKPSWTPDGKFLIFSANRRPDAEYEPQNSEIYELRLSDRRIRALTNRNGPDEQPVVSLDGLKIAYVGFDDRRQSYQITKLYVMDRDGGNSQVLTEKLDRDVQSPTWQWDGEGIFFQYDDRGNTKLARVSLDGKVENLAKDVGGTTIGRPYASGSFSISGSGYVYTYSRPDHPADVFYKHDENDKRNQRLTNLNGDLFGHKKLAEVEELWFESSCNEKRGDKTVKTTRKIQAWIAKPPIFDPKKKYPLILEIHGGPFANYGDRFSTEVQLYAAAGYVVLYVNPRGSTSYGQEFASLIHHAYPGNDYDDLMAGVDAVIDRGFIDKDNLFVTGGSGGGVLTAWIVGKTNRFQAAVSAKPVINWYSFTLTSDAYAYFAKYWFPGFPWDNAEHYLKRSPLSLVGNVQTPTMLLTGEEDYRTPISESEQFYQALKLRKIDTALVRIPGASHGIVARPSRLIAKTAHVLKWFEMYRK